MEELINPSKFSQILSVKKIKEGSYRLDRCFASLVILPKICFNQKTSNKKTQNTKHKKKGFHLLHHGAYKQECHSGLEKRLLCLCRTKWNYAIFNDTKDVEYLIRAKQVVFMTQEFNTTASD